ncbi:Ankyrin repeat and death domain-containing protein 1A [Melipona quadrifasciata]|uniref:Ankyrin repeat and death domain-containing protein 1A n=1 Tax=Melipona quadrifasciata TaxID=166423 RepID=A0A0M8ZTM0_9HYME|nr:Ankyrin repeat and death domain-containing protein 1A [Melipona quadrifasciata]
MVDKGEITKTPSPLNINDAIEGEVLNQKTARILRNDLLLYEAVIKNEADTVRKVLKETVDVNSRNNFGMRPLHMAARYGHRDAVKMLINAGASVSAVNKKQHTLLMCAAQGNNVHVVEYLAEAVESLNGDVITALANVPRIELNARDKKGQTPVHYACTQEHLEAVEVLIGLGANVDAQDSEGNTPLHVATRTRHTAIAQLLLRTGANTELIDEMGFTPLHVAASQGCKGILDSMIQHGAALNKQCKYGNTPLHLACQNNEVETVEILINKGVDLNCLNSRLQSPIHIAAEMGHTDICELLLAAGANIEQREQVKTKLSRCSQGGKTPLYIAARGSFTAIVDMIIKTARLDYPTPEDSTSDKETRDLTPARRRWREGSRGGSISSNNGALSEHIRSILWKLAYKQLGPEDWKKLALHWAFTYDQIQAIEHQYTGPSSYKEHGFRMLMIWASGLSPEVSVGKELCDALSAVDKNSVAESVRKHMDQEKEGKTKLNKQRCHKCSIT